MAMDERQWQEELDKLKAQMAEGSRLESELARRRQQLAEEQRRVTSLEVQLDREEEDVRRLTEMSWTNLFHTLLRSKEEQLEMERQQALAAALRLQESVRTVGELKEEIADLLQRQLETGEAERRYRELIAERERQLLVRQDAPAAKLMELDEALAEANCAIKEWEEALDAGRSLRAALEAAESSLDKAHGWGTWDMLGGGMLTTMAKHSYIDEARDHVHRARRLLDRFRQELADLRMTTGLDVEVDGFSKFADFFFDGLVIDWIMQNRIDQSRAQVQRHREAVGQLMRRLQEGKEQAERDAAKLRWERSSLLEGGGG